jgi:peptidoglycan/xylan/chitin deacetylase (PgdA/CDA1 family)
MTFKVTYHALRAFAWGLSHSDFLVVFNWHQVTPLFEPLCHHEYTWTQLEDFEAEVDYLIREFDVMPLHEAIRRFDRGALRGPCAALTFDDGDASMAKYVVPALRQRDLPATFFINSAYLDCKRSYWFPILSYLCNVEDKNLQAILPQRLKDEALQLRTTNDPSFYNAVRKRIEELASWVPNLESRLITTRWLADLDGDQFAIGAHGHEHQRFSMMSAEWQHNDLRENVRVLSQFQAYRPVFAVPFGRPSDWTNQTIRIARQQGLEVVLANGGLNARSGETYQRIPSDGRVIRELVSAAKSEALTRRRSLYRPLVTL